MRITTPKVLMVLGLLVLTSGCGSNVNSPRFWWDDRNQVRISDNYQLPPDPGASNDYGLSPDFDPGADASGEDLTDDHLRDYRTNLDQEEEKRKSEASIVDF